MSKILVFLISKTAKYNCNIDQNLTYETIKKNFQQNIGYTSVNYSNIIYR